MTPPPPDRTVLIGRIFDPVQYIITDEDIADYLPVAGEEYSAFGFIGWQHPESHGDFAVLQTRRGGWCWWLSKLAGPAGSDLTQVSNLNSGTEFVSWISESDSG